MADTIPDLWPQTGLKPTVLTPAAILRVQATQLAQRTQGVLIGEVVSETQDNQVVLGFDVIAPALRNYRHRLLTVQYAKNAKYPALVKGAGLTTMVTETYTNLLYNSSRKEQVSKSVGEKIVFSENSLVDALQQVLGAPETIAVLQSLIIQSTDEPVSHSSKNEDIAEEGEQTKAGLNMPPTME